MDSIINDNESLESSSGAIFNAGSGEVTITGSTLSFNRSGNEGGAMRNNGTLVVDGSTFSNNTAGTRAGGILGSDVTITNSTISGNTATTGEGGGIQIDGAGTLTNVTITNNTSSDGAGIRADGDVNIVNTIIAGNNGDDCAGAITSAGHNLDGDGTCGLLASGDLPNMNAMLGPLAANGGPTQTHALLVGSPAIDAGDGAACPAIDQRGVARDAVCDIGAFEFVVVGEARTWGDNNCSGAPDPVDSLLALRFDGGLPAETNECPEMGEIVEVASGSPHPWGDIDCSGAVNPVDSLKLLRFDAGLDIDQEPGCPPVGVEVTVIADA
jgi:hypothetical protein